MWEDRDRHHNVPVVVAVGERVVVGVIGVVGVVVVVVGVDIIETWEKEVQEWVVRYGV